MSVSAWCNNCQYNFVQGSTVCQKEWILPDEGIPVSGLCLVVSVLMHSVIGLSVEVPDCN